MLNIKELLKKTLFFIVAIFLANIISSFVVGFLTGFGESNAQYVKMGRLIFDPLTTICYLMLFYFLNLAYHTQKEVNYPLFLLSLYLSFIVSFVQGAIFLIVVFFILKKFRVNY